jgi:NAD(P)-dependent dehydrogenase (short-subunit alcohol dehydrogenase family)
MKLSIKTILVTGGNSGVGYGCCLALAKLPHTHVILAGRSKQRVSEAVAAIKTEAHATSEVEEAVVDIGSLASVRAFTDSLRGRQLFSIVCNAGIQKSTKELTVDGFESTFGINHLGHFLLVNKLRKQTSRVIMIASETHDPAEKTGMPHPYVKDLDKLARGLEPYNGREAYATSKLLNLLFAAEFARRFPNGPEIVSYTPGFTPDTSLYREYSAVTKAILMPILKAYACLVGMKVSTSAISGGWMARFASEDPVPLGAQNAAYIRIDEVWKTSALAQDKDLGKELWEKSAALI